MSVVVFAARACYTNGENDGSRAPAGGLPGAPFRGSAGDPQTGATTESGINAPFPASMRREKGGAGGRKRQNETDGSVAK